MALLPHEQFLSLVSHADRPLIMLRANADADDFATAFGLSHVLGKLGKQPDIVSAGGITPKSLQFIADGFVIRGDLPNIRTLTIDVGLTKANVDELSYAVEDGKLRIRVTPKTGAWSADDVHVHTNGYRYDLIIMIGVPELAALGALAERYADFIAHTPVINIDHSTENEHHGHLNLVDVSAVASSEVCFTVLERMDETLLDIPVVTCLLTGMIAKTKSFKTPNVTPKTLKIAGSLMHRGAKRDEIVEKLYRTRSVETLRLWGRALARLKADAGARLAWTMITREDFLHAGADEHALEGIVEELLVTAPEARVVAILFEHADGHVAANIHAERPHDALALGAPFKASGTREAVHCILPTNDIVAAEKSLIGHLLSSLTAS